MSREDTLAFMDARETEAHQRYESLRQKFLDASAQNHADARNLRPRKVEDTRGLEVIETPPSLVAADAEHIQEDDKNETDVKTTTSPNLAESNVDDVMDRIARLLDER